MTDGLIEFLRARLDEDKAAAEAATGGEWGAIDHTRPFAIFDVATYQKNDSRGLTGRYAVGAIERSEDRAHIARHDPARVLREVEAKRRILAEYAEVADNDIDEPHEYAYGWANGLGVAVRLLAAVYDDHPEYRQEWAP